MKISQLIEELQRVMESSGDGEVSISVRDYYSRYGHSAKLSIDTSGGLWGGVHTTRNGDDIRTVLDAHLQDYKEIDGTIKHPKVTFRN